MIKKIEKYSAIFKSENEKDTLFLSKIFAKMLRGGEIVFLYGPIGSGKTTFVKGLAASLKISSSPVSASFTLSREYRSKKFTLYHIDLFRLSQCEVHTLGLEEILRDKKAVTAVEWPKPAENFFPSERIKVEIELMNEDKRRFTFTAIGKKNIDLIKKVEMLYDR